MIEAPRKVIANNGLTLRTASLSTPVLLDFLRQAGADLCALIDDPQLRDARPDNWPADGSAPLGLVTRLWQAAATYQADIGLDLQRHYPEGFIHYEAVLVSHARTLADAIKIGAHYYHLVCAEESLVLKHQGGHTQLCYEQHWAEHPCIQLVEHTLAGAAQILCRLCPNHQPILGARFNYPAPAYLSSYQHAFGPRLEFDADVNCLLIDPALLTQVLPGDNPYMAHVCAEILEQRHHQWHSAHTLTGQIGDAIRQVLREGRRPSLAAVAEQLGQTEARLVRQLRQQHNSFRQVLDECRQETAATLLAAGHSAKEIAYRLGFSEPSAFHHARKRWLQAATDSGNNTR